MPNRRARVVRNAVVATTLGALAAVFGSASPAAAVPDTAAPVVSAVAFQPSSIDDTAADTMTTLKLHTTDATGFDHGTVTLASGTTTLDPIDFNNSSRTAGSNRSGDFGVEVDIPQGTAPGSYVPAVQVTDTVPNAGSATFAASPLTITRGIDNTSPNLAGAVQVSPNSVAVASDSQTVTYTAHLTDDLSGVVAATLTLVDPTGTTTTLALDLDSGSATDGTWTADTDVPAGAARGSWRVGSLVAHDFYGNTLTQTDDLGGDLTVTGYVDNAGPKLLSVTPAGATADTTSKDAAVQLSVRATDDVSGLDSGALTFSSPDGSQTAYAYLDGAPVAGTATTGIWHTTVTFPARATGTWMLTAADLFDGEGNESSYGSGGTKPPTAHVQLTAAADDTAPVATALTLGPSEVTTAYADGQATVVGHLTFTDDVSGLDTVDIALQGPDGTVDPSDDITADVADDLSSGTAKAGVLSFVGTIEQADVGTWSVDSVTVTDRAGNSVTYPAAKFGTPTFTVGTAATDTLAPTLTALTITPGTVAAGEAVSVSVGVTDPDADPSGFAGGSVTLAPPSGDPVEFDVTDAPITGDDVNGTYLATQPLAADAADGTWTVDTVTLTDGAGNSVTYSADQVAQLLGGPVPTLDVAANADAAPASATSTAPFAPTDVHAIATTGSAVITFAAADDGGSPVTGYRVAASTGGGSCATTGTSCRITGLRNGTTYSFTVRATNAVGTSAASLPTASVVPRAPTKLTLDISRTTSRAKVGAAVRVLGKLVRSDTRAAAGGQFVRLQYRKAGSTGAFATFATQVKTTSTGWVTFSNFHMRYRVQVRLYFPTHLGYGGSVSLPRTIAVRS